jgi:hypothetical protein
MSFMLGTERKPLLRIILGAFAGLTTAANAVNLGNDGTGQVLIYPYYTVRTAGPGDWATYLNVVNHTTDTKALRLRFREGKNGRSVFDMNVYLGSGDVWAGAVAKTSDGAQLLSADRSCVSAAGSYSQSVAAGTLSAAFSNAMYVGPSTSQGVFDGHDGEDGSLDRTREGFFEIIEMGVVTSTAIINGLKHDDSGVPVNCGVVANINGNVIGSPRGGLSGGASLIHVLKGADFGYEPVVLEDFYRPASAGDNLWTAPGNRLPDLSQATPLSRVMYLHKSETAATPDGMVTDVLEATWDRGIDAVSAVLMRNVIKNTFVLDTATQSSTDWVVTFPTKHHYISANAPGSSVPNDPNGTQRTWPFHNFFWTGGSADPMYFKSYDREAQTFTTIQSPPAPPEPLPRVRWQTNVGTISRSSKLAEPQSTLLGSINRIYDTLDLYFESQPRINDLQASTFQNGHAWLSVLNPLPLIGKASPTSEAETYFGLPVVGFMVHDFLNTGVSINGMPSASSYGANFNHKYERFIRGGNVRP